MKGKLLFAICFVLISQHVAAQVVVDTVPDYNTDSLIIDDNSYVISTDTVVPVEETPVNNDNLLNSDIDDDDEDNVALPEVNNSEKKYEKVNDDNLKTDDQLQSVAERMREKGKEANKGEIQAHFNKVWSYRSYFNLGWNNISIKPKNDIQTGYEPINGGLVPDFKSDWALSLQLGRSYKLHKKPIGNTLQFYIDYTGIDLSGSHFKQEDKPEGVEYLYDSSQLWEKGDKSYRYIPWNIEKFELCYGMNIGPSITVAPFTSLKNQDIHFLKLNLYYHIGYAASFIFVLNDKKADAQVDGEKTNMISWGHGLTNTFGVSLTFKNIGIGYEHQSMQTKYKSFDNDYGKESYKFNKLSNRFYISLRFGH